MKHLEMWCQKVIPLAYDDSLSYYEVLCKMKDYINNLIDEDTEMLSRIEELEKKQSLTRDEIQAMIDTSLSAFLTVTITPLIENSKRESISASKNYTDEVVAREKELIITQCTEYSIALYNQMKEYVDSKFVEYMYMYSPITGKMEDVRLVVDELINNFHKSEAITAGEYDALNLTAGDYDSRNLTAFQYDFHAKTLLS